MPHYKMKASAGDGGNAVEASITVCRLLSIPPNPKLLFGVAAMLNYTCTDTQFNISSAAFDPDELVLVSVSASNSAGKGARSPGVRGRTREERELSQQECDLYLS